MRVESGGAVRSGSAARDPVAHATNREAVARGDASAQPVKATPVGRRVDRSGHLSTEDRKRLMAEPAVRRAVELSGGSIVDVVRRGVPSESDAIADDGVDAIGLDADEDHGVDDSAFLDDEARDSGAN